MSLTEMSRKLKVPISSLFDTFKEVEKHFHFTIVPKEGEAAATVSSPFEFAYQITIDPAKKAGNS